MLPTPRPVLFVFLDGVGVGPADPAHNPLLRAELPTLRSLLEGPPPTVRDPERVGPRGTAFPLDATLGVSGTPRSGTGQTALLTGRNAAELHGTHFGPWTPVALRPILADESFLRRARERGFRVAFANAYPRDYRDRVTSRSIAPITLAAEAADLLVRHDGALRRGRAVATEIVNDGWRTHLGVDVPRITPREAGRHLAALAARHDLTLFAHYATDHAGHGRNATAAVAALERVDRFLGGLVDAMDEETLLVMASDHGNLEDLRAQHTRNPALGLLAGPDAVNRRRGLRAITDVADAVLRWLGTEAPSARRPESDRKEVEGDRPTQGG